ncbi:MAG: hypothetical protein WCL51_18550 [Bacteroidota bacterium]
MENIFAERMSQRTNSELLKIIYEQKNDYQPEAVEAAELEIKKRNLSEEEIKESIQENKTKKVIEIEKANMKLAIGFKILTFIFPGFLQIVFAGTFKADGYDRKARELARWTINGFIFYVVIILLLIIQSYFIK